MIRNRKLIIRGLGVVILVVILWLIAGDHKEGRVENSISADTEHHPVPQNVANSSGTANSKLSEMEARREDAERRRKEYSGMWRTPIVFYGRVLDEQELPVSGAKIDYSAITIDATLTLEGHIQATVYSDAKGLFEISGIRARDVGFQVSHPDYYSSGKNRTVVSYAGDRDRNIPATPNKAWVFRMYKKRKPVKLVNSSGGGHAQMDGSVLIIKLDKYSQIRAEGKSSKPKVWDGKPFDWEVRLSVPNGEIMECTDEVTFNAPTDGYKPEFKISMSKDGKKWKTDIERSFYIKSGNVFGRVNVFVSTYHDLYLSVHYTINPDGSTNLESGNGSRITGP